MTKPVQARVVAVIPSLNTASTIQEVVSEAKKHVSQVIVIDDGSHDGTAEMARAAGALVISYPDPIAVVTTAKTALSLNPRIKILARVHRVKEADALRELGVTDLVSPEYEASVRFIKRLLNIVGLEKQDRRRILALVRKDEEIAEFNPDESV